MFMRSIRPANCPAREVDEMAARNVCSLFYKGYEKVQRYKPVTVDWHDHSPCAGKGIPDKTVVFGEQAYEWLLFSNDEPHAEEKIWSVLDGLKP